MSALQIVFMGTPDLACASLEALLNSKDVRVIAVVTQPDRPKGRELKTRPSPVKEFAQRHGLAMLQPLRAKEPGFFEALRALQPDLIVVAAYGQILPRTILDLPRYGCINVHTSLLPRYRGAAPIQWAILNGDPATGVTIMKMDVGMDTGPIISQRDTTILPEDTGQTLHDRLAKIGAELLVQTIPRYVSGEIQPRPQPDEGIVHATKIRKEDGRIDWTQSARAIWNRVRALVPWPVAFTFLPGSGQLLKIWEAQVASGTGMPGTVLRRDNNGIVVACGTDALTILAVQKEGGRRMTASQFLAGHDLNPGQQFSAGQGPKAN